MTLSLSLPLQNHYSSNKTSFLPYNPFKLDRHVVRQNKIRFVQKLKTLLLSKPKHYIPLHILSKCKSYLSLPDRRSIRSMIHRYPSIFELFSIPTPPLPINATKPYSQLCVRLTPPAAALAAEELKLQSAISNSLAAKLQKLLMLSSHRRLILSKLVHLAPDLGLPPNFRSRLCNDHPDKFKTVDTSYGRALELVSWDAQLAIPLSRPDVSLGLIVDRPLKFKHLTLRKGHNLKRRHQDFLIKFEELPEVCPYRTSLEEFSKKSILAEKRACAVIREVLEMTVERRTLIDHLTHFRKEFGLPNQLRGMIARHPELFYVSLKGLRNSVFLIEGYDDKGMLLKKDEVSAMKDQLMKLVSKSKRMRRERKNGTVMNNSNIRDSDDDSSDEFDDNGADVDYDDGFDNVFKSEDVGFDCDFGNDVDESYELWGHGQKREFWITGSSFDDASEKGQSREPW
ncbi:protein WHAT'S THIS FACTOR 1, chloroplastic isoform X2 [Jatropha curcas]|uniref:protein WHAT'S THIS FACTOR 1, chloroplastic isoform X2 n=1 Tax=Jatropha curcas TaxID=180498 RepID=UPI0005FADFA2|nr:protein WHAT'S THIS FACTOR 1, chloroplastic isoform X2 [Jatropha curcas]